MSDEQSAGGLAPRVRSLAEFLESSDLARVRIDRSGESFEVARAVVATGAPWPVESNVADGVPEPPARRLDVIAAGLVGIFRLGRPAPAEGDVLDGDRELAFVEALGIRNPVRSLGAGRLVRIACKDGSPVEYGQTLFEMDRG